MRLRIAPLRRSRHNVRMATDDQFEEIRSGVRALCAQFPDEYFRNIDAARGYPAVFVDALTKAEIGRAHV